MAYVISENKQKIIDYHLQELEKLDSLDTNSYYSYEQCIAEILFNAIVLDNFPDNIHKAAEDAFNFIQNKENLYSKNIVNLFKNYCYQFFHILPGISHNIGEQFHGYYDNNMKVTWDENSYYIKEVLKICSPESFKPIYSSDCDIAERLFHQIIISSNGPIPIKEKIQDKIDEFKKDSSYDAKSLLILIDKMENLFRLFNDDDFMKFLKKKKEEIMKLESEKKIEEENEEKNTLDKNLPKISNQNIFSKWLNIGWKKKIEKKEIKYKA